MREVRINTEHEIALAIWRHPEYLTHPHRGIRWLAYGGRIDLLGVAGDGTCLRLEVKKHGLKSAEIMSKLRAEKEHFEAFLRTATWKGKSSEEWTQHEGSMLKETYPRALLRHKTFGGKAMQNTGWMQVIDDIVNNVPSVLPAPFERNLAIYLVARRITSGFRTEFAPLVSRYFNELDAPTENIELYLCEVIVESPDGEPGPSVQLRCSERYRFDGAGFLQITAGG